MTTQSKRTGTITDELLAQASRSELYNLAQEHDIAGRSSMNKRELAKSLAAAGSSDKSTGSKSYNGIHPTSGAPRSPSGELDTDLEKIVSRYAAFEALAKRAASGEFVMLPSHLTGNDRRLHVRQTIREDHQTRIAVGGAETEAKFKKLADSVFAFFRGTAFLFYRDMAGEDAWMPTVLNLGDVHPGNFGIMPNADNVPIFAVNDFDDADYAPFTWDLKRGTTAFILACAEKGGHGTAFCRHVARHFIKSYVRSIKSFEAKGNETDHEIRHDNAPKLLRKLFKSAEQERAQWLAEDYHDEYGRGFRTDEELVPISRRRDEFQTLIDKLAADNDINMPHRVGKRLKVKDVAIRHGQGTASLGLPRYYVLIEGINADASDDLIVEFKRARRSSMAGLAPAKDSGFDSHAERIANAQAVQLSQGDVFYGSVDIDGYSFMTRERAPFRDDIDMGDLSKKNWKKYAAICGRALAHAHAMSDETGRIDYDVEPLIIKAIGRRDLFIDDILRWSEEAVTRVRTDHAHFVSDHKLGAFQHFDVAFQ
ncbi:DUF2252 domain-containing protein [Granulosicoccus sp.]|nr:DUF2252 domain-containing protein [Granulosicoccus sp.]